MNSLATRTEQNNRDSGSRRVIAIGVVVVIAVLHLLGAGHYLSASLYTLYYSYFSDIAVPVAAYFILCATELRFPPLANWQVKSIVVFGAAAFAETMQGLGVPVLGRTFDPLDFVMFAAGTLIAVVVDQVILARFVPGWSSKNLQR